MPEPIQNPHLDSKSDRIKKGIDIVKSGKLNAPVTQDLMNFHMNMAADKMRHDIDSHTVDALRYSMMPQPAPKPRNRLQRVFDAIKRLYYRIGKSVTYRLMDAFDIREDYY